MDDFNGKLKKGLITKTWKRCRSWPCSGGGKEEEPEDRLAGKQRVAPEGCFSVYVGPQKQRFVIPTEYVNHPLFRMLLEEAESEYGYNSEGPLTLPCNVDLFVKVLAQMDGSDEIRQGWAFAKGYDSYRLLSPSRLISMNKF